MTTFSEIEPVDVLILGDVMLDTYWQCEYKGPSAEADASIFSILEKFDSPGGAGNVAWNVNSLGSRAHLLGLSGDDAEGRTLRETLAAAGIDSFHLLKDHSRPTTVKYRILDGHNRQRERFDRESSQPLSPKLEKELITEFNFILESEPIQVIILQDYNKGVLTPAVIDNVRKACREKDILLAVDPKFDNFEAYRGAHLFKPNLKEWSAYTGSVGTGTEIIDNGLAEEFMRKQHIAHLLITLSGRGIYYRNSESWGTEPALEIEDPDVSGAGDTVISIASICLANGWPLDRIAGIANKAAGAVCRKKGVQPVKPEDLLD